MQLEPRSFHTAFACTIFSAFILLAAPANAQQQMTAPPDDAQQPATPLEAGMQAFMQGNYTGAYSAAKAAEQQSPADNLARAWESVALAAEGQWYQSGAALVGVATPEGLQLEALEDWHQGNRDGAKSYLNICLQAHPGAQGCATLIGPIQSGMTPPPVANWPEMVGLTALTQQQAANVYMPFQPQ